ADVSHQSTDMGAGRGAWRRRSRRADRPTCAHLLRRRPHASPRLGLRLRRLSCLRTARQRLGCLASSASAMTYSVKEMFFTLQGEGARTGRPAVFVRFSGCNLWSGREADRTQAICQFCDTEFVGTDGEGGGKFET